MAVLYRKYRPRNFAEVLNQKYIIRTLKNQVESEQVSHAYLFTGTRGVGKTSVARILAKAVNCVERSKNQDLRSKKNNGDACGQCQVCKQIEEGNFLDLVEIDAASNTGVDNIRDLIEHVKFNPAAGKYKVFIIDEVHMLSKGAFNALLKTLEEPPSHAIFILATTEVNKVPATIVSRTQRFDFKRLASEDLESHLAKILKAENIKLPEEAIKLVAQNAEGSVRDSLSLLDKIATLGGDCTLADCQQLLGITDIAVCENLLELIALGKAGDIPAFFDSLLEKGLDFQILNKDFLEYLRKALIFKVSGAAAGLPSAAAESKLQDLAGKFSANELIFTVRLFLKSFKDLAASPRPDIPLLLAGLEAVYKKTSAVAPARPQEIVAESASVKYQANTAPPKVSSATLEVQNLSNSFAEETVSRVGGPPASLEELQQVWPQVVEKIKAINSPLANLVKNSPAIDVRGNAAVLGVKFLFHKQNLENAKNRAIICQALEEVLGKKINILSQVAKESSEETASPASAITDALKIFGGELIE
ncbi:MAG: DNA polymerase III subunit gamma/tau [Patescibacteria group bacterium]|nr:DNA polymerase III subunit gamma/tau [Patescibacteria group bacterium]